MPVTNTRPTGAQEFTASGNFTVPGGVTRVFVSGCGGGGGSVYDGVNAPGAGGAGRSVVRKPMAVTPGAVLPVVIGAAGAVASAGGATTFNGLSLNGGSAGTSWASGSASQLGQPSAFGSGTTGLGNGYGVGGGCIAAGSQSTGTAGYLLIEW